MIFKKFVPGNSLLRVVSALLTNVSAGAIGLVIFTPNFTSLHTLSNFLALTYDIVVAIVCLDLAVRLDKKISL